MLVDLNNNDLNTLIKLLENKLRKEQRQSERRSEEGRRTAKAIELGLDPAGFDWRIGQARNIDLLDKLKGAKTV